MDPLGSIITNNGRAESVAAYSAKYARPIVAYSSLTTEASEACVILARKTMTQFVFEGAVRERATLVRTLAITPNIQLGMELVSRLSHHIFILPYEMRDVVSRMLHTE